MIERFEVKNFRCFKDSLVFDFKSNNYSFNDDLIINNIINKTIVYGKNGIGKSNLGLALFDITIHLTDNFKQDIINSPGAYVNLDNNYKIVNFKYRFNFNKEIVEYEYSKKGPQELLYEKLIFNNDKILEIDYSKPNDFFIDKNLVNNLNLVIKDNKLSIIKYIYRNIPTDTIPLLTKMMEFVNHMLWYRSLSNGNQFIGFTNQIFHFDDVLAQYNKVDAFKNFLHDNGIDLNLSLEEINGINILYVNYLNDKIPFNQVASTGTNTLYLFFCWKTLALDKVSFLFIDEYDAFLHFESAALLTNQLNKIKNFQQVLTTHNTYLMNNQLTRPDCCFIMTKNKITSLSNSTDKEIREAHNLEKMYRNGAFINE